MGAVVELTNEEWGLVARLFDPPVHRGVKGTIPKRDMVDAILWLARTGCQWRHLPDRFPDWQAVWSQWRRWRDKRHLGGGDARPRSRSPAAPQPTGGSDDGDDRRPDREGRAGRHDLP